MKTIPRKKLLFILGIVSAAWNFTYLLYAPSSVILTGLAEVPVKYSWLLPASLVYFACGTLLLFLIGLLLPGSARTIYTLILFSITLAGYVQNNVLNGKLYIMDGSTQTFSTRKILIDLLIWLIILILPFIVYRKKSGLAMKLISYISIFFLVSQLITMGILWISTDYSVQQTKKLTTSRLTSFHKENNVLVIVLDWFDRQIMDDITAQDSEFVLPLKDFTNYTNTTSCYSFTYMSVPYLLSGVKWPGEIEEIEYMSYSSNNSTFPKRLHELGCDIQLYTDSVIMREPTGQYVQNYTTDIDYRYDIVSFAKFWNKCAGYSLLPFAAKSYCSYTTEELYDIISDSNIYGLDDAATYHMITEQGLIVEEKTNGLFKFLHLTGAHKPYKLTKDYQINRDGSVTRDEQAKASMGIVFEIIAKMKEAGIYDTSTIIITADHGQNFLTKPDKMEANGLRPVSSPILFVKADGETHDSMVISSAPVSHEEFFASVLKAFGDDAYHETGKSFDEIDSDESRTRIFMHGLPSRSPWVQYSITGDVMNEDSWHLDEVLK